MVIVLKKSVCFEDEKIWFEVEGFNLDDVGNLVKLIEEPGGKIVSIDANLIRGNMKMDAKEFPSFLAKNNQWTLKGTKKAVDSGGFRPTPVVSSGPGL
jgi:hypothetical protein